uniref:Uncharacterized protein n=1 Tax=Oryza brachyantha TaxID=4533 RepID=J3L1G2_ORYBR
MALAPLAQRLDGAVLTTGIKAAFAVKIGNRLPLCPLANSRFPYAISFTGMPRRNKYFQHKVGRHANGSMHLESSTY